ncbi:MAG: hypothetical protein BWY63_03748 [Chloroflexi bacterium ADurb.Bin360]|nr:MAG: hypothetical protein BWY63_03748 [Chloroflexi bacterium ADurb.Bin360]
MTGRAIILFGGRIFRGPHTAKRRLCARVARVPELSQSKIHQHHLTIRLNEHILGLDIAVDDPLSMAIAQGIKNLYAPGDDFRLRKSAMRDQRLVQADTQHQVHDQVGVSLPLEGIRDPHQVGVTEQRE